MNGRDAVVTADGQDLAIDHLIKRVKRRLCDSAEVPTSPDRRQLTLTAKLLRQLCISGTALHTLVSGLYFSTDLSLDTPLKPPTKHRIHLDSGDFVHESGIDGNQNHPFRNSTVLKSACYNR